MPCNATAEVPPSPQQHCPFLYDENDIIIEAEEEELFVAMGNAAKAARRSITFERKPSSEFTTATCAGSDLSNVKRIAEDGELNEDCTTTSHATTTNTNTAHSTDDNVANGNDDSVEKQAYVGSGARAYKTNGTATLSQSEQKIQQQEPDELAATTVVGPFLDQTWNWLRYALVTLLLLNFVKFCEKLWSAILNFTQGEPETVLPPENSAEVKVIDGEIDDSTTENSATREENDMSPNTCSLQNQEEVEKAEEAIMAVGLGTEQQQKEEAASKVGEGDNKEPTIVSPSVDQVVVETRSEESDDSVDNRRDSVDSYASSEGSGNLGDVEAENYDKSSEASSENGDAVKTTEEVTQRIIAQVESMFSDDHLAKDGFLLKHVRRRSDGFVSLKLVAGLRKVKQISREFPVVLNALKDSSKLEVNSEGTKVRRVEPLTPLLKSLPIKSKEKENNKEKDASSNDENQQPNINSNNKSASKPGNKENNENGSRAGSRRNSAANMGGNQSRRNSNVAPGGHLPANRRKSSATSSASSNNSSRHNSFSRGPGLPPQHPADLFRNVCLAAYSSSGDENQSPQVGRRRGGSLPIAALQHRASHNGYLSPNSSPPNASGTLILGPNGARPKSNSYCEGASPTTMSPWLQRRKASATSRLSSGELIFSGVLRQPRGPDGTKGFASGYRAMILQERLDEQPQNSAVSA